MKTFSDRLKHARRLRGHTQKGLARACGLSQSAIGSYESGQRQSSRSLRKIASALKVELEWLETGKAPMEKRDVYEMCEAPARHDIMEPVGTTDKARPLPVQWPFSVPMYLYDTLATHDKRVLDRMVRLFVEACHGDYGAPKSKARRGG